MRPNKKLDFKFHGPFRVEAAVGAQSYRLALPDKWKIYPVFHVSLLEPFVSDGRHPDEAKPPPDLIEDKEEWELEAILDSRITWNTLQYRVKWKGWPDFYDEWLPAKELGNARELMVEFHCDNTEKSRMIDEARKRKRGRGQEPTEAKGQKKRGKHTQ